MLELLETAAASPNQQPGRQSLETGGPFVVKTTPGVGSGKGSEQHSSFSKPLI